MCYVEAAESAHPVFAVPRSTGGPDEKRDVVSKSPHCPWSPDLEDLIDTHGGSLREDHCPGHVGV